MSRHRLNVALILLSTLGLSASFSGCSSNYQVLEKMPTGTSPTVASSSHKAASHNSSHKASTAHPAWSYAGATGPEFWGDLDDNASACKIGQAQSPINITQVMASKSAAPVINYSQTADIKIHNNGHTIVYTPTTTTNAITLENEQYTLKQFHYHIPSEHQLAGKNYPGELHFVHANAKGNLAVIGVMLQPGQANAILRILLNGTQLSIENNVKFTANNVNLAALIPNAPTFYNYDGSLTTPPCSEQVQWYVTKQPISLASDQFAIMYDLYDGNNRPVRPQGERVVEQLGN